MPLQGRVCVGPIHDLRAVMVIPSPAASLCRTQLIIVIGLRPGAADLGILGKIVPSPQTKRRKIDYDVNTKTQTFIKKQLFDQKSIFDTMDLKQISPPSDIPSIFRFFHVF